MNKRFYSLDAFRGICALSVVIFHMGWLGSITEFDFFRGSSILVEFFFCLSGFVLAHGYGFKVVKLAPFMKKRFLRLYPLHLFAFLCFFLIELAKFSAIQLFGFNFEGSFLGEFSFTEIIPNLLLIHAWTPYFEQTSWNYPSWSISIEIYMYLIFALSLMFTSKYRRVAWFSLSIATFTYIIFNLSDLDNAARGLSCFFGGAITYTMYSKFSNLSITTNKATFLEVVMMLAVYIVVSSQFLYRDVISSLVFFSVILVFSLERGKISKYLRSNTFQWLGLHSYSIYMIHAVIIALFYSFKLVLVKLFQLDLFLIESGRKVGDLGSPLANNLAVLVIVSFVLVVSKYTHKYIEMSWLKNKNISTSGG
jgi:peptidoglycan/LPS O-acetylase OafA/YrhL